MKAILPLLLIVVLSLNTCRNSGNNLNTIPDDLPYIIDLGKSINNPKSDTLYTIGTKLEFVPLETNPSCLIQRIDKIVCDDSFIFISDVKGLLQFSRSGQFIRQVGSNGRGPGEYLNVRDFCIDSKDNNIFIHSAIDRKILVFDLDGNFIRSFKSPGQTGQIILKDSNSLMFHLGNIARPSNEPRYSWYITDKKGVISSSIKNSLIRQNMPGFSTFNSPLYFFKENVHFMEYGIDTLYFFNNSKKNPYAILNLGDLKADPDPLLNNKEILDMFNEKYWVSSILEDDKNMYIKLNRGATNSFSCCIYNKQSSEVTFLENGVFLNNLYGEIPFWPQSVYHDSILVDFMDSFNMIEFINKTISDKSKTLEKSNFNQLESLRNLLNETSNPVIMILK